MDDLALNWVRVAWTLAFAILALLAFFVYIDYSNLFRERSAELEGMMASGPGKAGGGKSGAKPTTSPRSLPRRSRKYRMRR